MRRRPAIVALLAGVLAAAAVLVATAHRPIATPDSFSYLGAARSLATQGALRIPTTEWIDDDSTSALHQFPPGYPAALAVAIRLGASPLAAARFVDAGAALVTTGAVAWLAAAIDGPVLALLAPVVLLAARGIAEAHLSALSEPLFLAAVAATVVLMAAAPRRAWAYGLTAAVADLVRYAGASIVVAAALWAAWCALRDDGDQPSSARWGGTRVAAAARAGVLAALPGALGHLLWMLHVRLEDFVPVGGALTWSGGLGRTLGEGARTLAEQLAPVALRWPWRGVLAAVIAVSAVALLHAGRRAARALASPLAGRAIAAALLVAGCYAATLLYSRALVGSTIPFDDRILAPLVLVLLVAAVAAVGALCGASRRHGRAWAAVALGALWLAAGAWQTVHTVRGLLGTRRDYARADRAHAPIATWLRRAGTGHALFTNDPVAIFFDVGRPSRGLPETLAPDTLAAFDTTLRAMDGAIVAYAHDVGFVPTADPTALARALALCPAVAAPEGVVWIERQEDGRCPARTTPPMSPESGEP